MPFPHFTSFVVFILQNHLDDFVRVQNQKVIHAKLPLLRYFQNLSPDEFFNFSKNSALSFLTSIKEQNAIETLKAQNLAWRSGESEIGKLEVVLTDMVTGNLLRKETFIEYLDHYTNDLSLYKILIKEIDQFYNEVLEISLTGFFEVQRDQIYKEKELNDTIINSSEDAIFSYDQETRVIVWNKIMERRTGVKKVDIIGKKLFETFPKFIESKAGVSIRKALVGETEKLIAEPFESQTGFYNSIGTPLFNSNKEIIGGVYILRDVTDDKLKERKLESAFEEVLNSKFQLEAAQEKLHSFNIHLEQKVRLRTYELESVNEINKVIAGNLNLKDIVEKITQITTELTNADFGIFYYAKASKSVGSLAAYTFASGNQKAPQTEITTYLESILAIALESKKSIRSENIRSDIRFNRLTATAADILHASETKSFMAVPVISRDGSVIGSLFFFHHEEGIFTPEAENIVSAVSSQASVALDNAQLFQDLKRSEENFRFMSEVIPQIVWTAEANGMVDYFNNNWTEYTGFTLEDSANNQTNITIHPDDLHVLNQAWKDAINNKTQFEQEYRLRRHLDGEYRWHLGRAHAMKTPNGQVEKWFGTITEIHDQKMAQENLLMQSRVLESMSEGVAVTDNSGYILYTNPAQDRMSGYPSGYLTGKHISIQLGNSQEENENTLTELFDALTTYGSWKGELVNVSKDGALFTTYSYISTLYVDSTTLFVCVQRDVTEEKKAQKEIQQNNQQLKSKNKELQRINNDLDNFIYTASHDLKAPVSNIEGLIQALDDTLRHTNVHTAEIASILDMVNGSVQRFQVTIKDLTEINKTQKGIYEESAWVNVRQVFEEVMLSISNLIAESEAEIDIKMDPALRINFSIVNLKSILYNLLSNALKYKDPERKAKVVVQAYTEGANLTITVHDNGLGIKKEYHEKVFQMFKRAHTHVEGSGVGLYIVKRIVDNAGGKIEIESKVGEGTMFKLNIPTLDFSEVLEN